MAGSRKNELRAIFGGGLAPGSEPAPETKSVQMPVAETPNSGGRTASGAVKAMGLSLNAMSREVEEARLLRQALSEGERVVPIHPDKIDSSIVEDRLRLGEQDDEDLAALIDSMRESGQQVPVLVRNHPEKPGRYQTAYGHRRIRAASRLGIEVKAIIRTLSDDELVLAQGKENAERRNLSFIERAVFAKNLLTHGFDRKVIGDALSVQKSELSRLLQVVESVPDSVIRAVGAAPKAGRDRWMKLSELLGSARAQASAGEETGSDAFQMAGSDERFQRLFDRLSKPQKTVRAEPLALTDRDGKVFAQMRNDGKVRRLEFSASVDNSFIEDVAKALTQQYNAFLSSRSQSKG